MMIDSMIFSMPSFYHRLDGYTTGNLTVSGNNYGQAIVFVVPYTCTVDKMAFWLTATTVGGDLTGQIETVTAATNVPSGTLYHANATGVRTMGTSDDANWFEITFTAPVTLTAGDRVALVLARLSGTFTGSMRRTIGANTDSPVLTERSGASWSTVSTRIAPLMLHETNGWMAIPGAVPAPFTTSVTVGAALTPDEAGVLFTPPATMRLVGVETIIASVASGDGVTTKLYDENDNVLWSEAVVYGTDYPTASTSRVVTVPRITLHRGHSYRVTWAATVLNANYTYFSFPSGAAAGFGFGDNFIWTERTDAGAWTNDDSRAPQITLLFDGFAPGSSETAFLS